MIIEKQDKMDSQLKCNFFHYWFILMTEFFEIKKWSMENVTNKSNEYLEGEGRWSRLLWEIFILKSYGFNVRAASIDMRRWFSIKNRLQSDHEHEQIEKVFVI